MTIRADSVLLEPGAEIKLIKLDMGVIDPSAGVMHFHPHNRDGIITWQGVEYHPWPVELEGFEKSGDKPATPTLTAANIDQSLTALCLQYDDLVGAIVTLKGTLVQYLDAVNFDGPEMITNQTFDTDASGWNLVSGTVSTVAGRLRVARGTGTGRVGHQLNCEIGKTYKVSVNCYVDNGGGLTYAPVYISISPTSTTNPVASDTTSGTKLKTLEFTATQATHWIHLQTGGGTTADQFVEFDNVSVKLKGVNPTADPDEAFPDEVWFVDQKEHEDYLKIKWRLSSALDFNGVQLPGRVIVANQCGWMYRSAECGYAGGPVAKYDDTPTSDPLLDNCSRRVSGCKLRFGENSELPYGNFPASGLMRS